jgi:hypothetical protein
MSLRSDLERLDAEYRATLTRRQLGVSLAVSRLFSSLAIEDILSGGPKVDDWLDRSLQISLAVRAKVWEEATGYMTEVQQLVFPRAAAPPVIPDVPPTLEQIRTSLWTTGIVSARKRIGSSGSVAQAPSLLEQSFLRRAADPEQGIPQRQRALEILDQGRAVSLQQEIDKSGEMAGAAAARHAGNASRDQVIASTRAGGRAIGWVRVTSSQPCFFCAALASRGPVYDGESFDESDARFEGPGRHKVHDHCSCSLRQVYTRSTEEWPALSQRLEDEWKSLGQETERLYGRRPTMKDWRERYATLGIAAA